MNIIDRALGLLLQHDMSGFVQLFAEDAVFEFPFAAPGQPERIEGRTAIDGYLHDYPEKLDIREIVSQTVYETTDPEVTIAEFEVAGVAVATQQPYRLRYIAVLTVRDGLIRHYRDYWSPLAVQEILGNTGV
ncbi:nuclear transport factor 2 family protein [Amycolatopsis ultiminotia]|uniref:Nuclear transport factor 2 family protein n=1 Tax=Amycolatopsis ultiminotia TaxID=543629 RepID=A0ABP6XXU5_9PSEU